MPYAHIYYQVPGMISGVRSRNECCPTLQFSLECMLSRRTCLVLCCAVLRCVSAQRLPKPLFPVNVSLDLLCSFLARERYTSHLSSHTSSSSNGIILIISSFIFHRFFLYVPAQLFGAEVKPTPFQTSRGQSCHPSPPAVLTCTFMFRIDRVLQYFPHSSHH